jgi:hydrogenase expression/formation protein HypC
MCLAIPMKITELKGKTAIVGVSGVEKEVNIELLENVKTGDYILIHAGFAIEKLNKKDAEETLKIIEQAYQE